MSIAPKTRGEPRGEAAGIDTRPAGGRRYYRPEDVDLLRAIRDLLYEQGYTIKGVQKLMREGGLKIGEEPVAAPAGEPVEDNAAAPETAPTARKAGSEELPLFRASD